MRVDTVKRSLEAAGISDRSGNGPQLKRRLIAFETQELNKALDSPEDAAAAIVIDIHPAPAPAPLGVAPPSPAAPPKPTAVFKADWLERVEDGQKKDGSGTYLFSGLHLHESNNLGLLPFLKAIKQYGNKAGGSHSINGFCGCGSPEVNGWTKTYQIRMKDELFRKEFKSIKNFKIVMQKKYKLLTGGDLAFEITGLDDEELPNHVLKIITKGDSTDIAIGGDTWWLTSVDIDIRRLGAANNVDTFMYNSDFKIFVSLMNHSYQEVEALCQNMLETKLKGHRVLLTTEQF